MTYNKLLAFVLVLVLSSFLSLTFFSHPNADDFCKAAEVHQMGFFGSVDHVYHNWSGRYVAVVSLCLQNEASGGWTLPNFVTGAAQLELIIALVTSIKFRSASADLIRMGKLQELFKVRYSLIDEAKVRSETDVIVPRVRYAFNSLWEDELKEDPSYWANRCWAEYFNLRSISLGNAVTPRL